MAAIAMSLDLAIRLQVVGRRSDVGHAALSDEVLKIADDELRSVAGEDLNCPHVTLLPYAPQGCLGDGARPCLSAPPGSRFWSCPQSRFNESGTVRTIKVTIAAGVPCLHGTVNSQHRKAG